VTPQQQRFFNTTTPYSSIAYRRGFTNGHEENDVSFLFTGNLNRRTNLGVEMEYLNSAGHYANTASKLFRGTVRKEDRSLMNVPFVTGNEELDAKFVKEATAAGFVNLKGHRTVGGMRASIYNAMPIEGVEKLVDFMKKFEEENA
jgi:hypothetical protein